MPRPRIDKAGFTFFRDRVEVLTTSAGGSETELVVWYDSAGNPESVKITPAAGVSARELQRFAWAQHLTIADLAWRAHHSPAGARRVAEDALKTQLESEMGATRRPVAKRGPRPKGEAFYEQIAARYLELRALGVPNPTQTIASQDHKSRNTAAGWVRHARELGYLPPARPGRPG